jgi:GTP cyclohydrolase I
MRRQDPISQPGFLARTMLTYYIPHTIVASSQPQARRARRAYRVCEVEFQRLRANARTAGTKVSQTHTNLRTEPAPAMNDIATRKAAIPLKPASRRRPTQAEAEEAVRILIAWAGDDPAREGLKDTPRRVVGAYEEYYSGYRLDPAEALSKTFDEAGGYDDLVMLRDIRVESHCEHHMTPFLGVAHVAYLPRGRIVGISKIARVVEIFAKRLQTQETMTAQIADAIEAALMPRGVAVLIEAEHQCMSMRGVRQPGVRTITSRFTGAMDSDASYRDRFLQMVHGPRF